MHIDVYKASAGSGKTFTLTQKYLGLLKKGTSHKQVLAVTFTNKATTEMKERIVETLAKIVKGEAKKEENEAGFTQQQANECLAELLHDYSHFNVSTIDGFYQQIMRSFVRELGLYGAYTLVLDTEEVIAKAVEELTFSLQNSENKDLYDWLLKRAKEKIEVGESWQYQAELTQLAGQLFREDVSEALTLLRELPNPKGSIDDFRTELIKTKKAILSQVNAAINAIKDIFSQANYDYTIKENSSSGILMQLNTKVSRDKWPEFTETFIKLIDNDEKAARAAFRKNDTASYERLEKYGFSQAMMSLGSVFRKYKVTYDTIDVMLAPIDLLPVLIDLERVIQNYLKENNMVLLSQVNGFLNKMIGQCDAPFIYEKMGNYLHHYMLDEFQDTSILQWGNFKPLITESLSRQGKTLIVGDIKQSIYRWRNSDWRILANIDQDFKQYKINHYPALLPGKQTKPATTNWRSYKDIVLFNNAFFTEFPQEFSSVDVDGVLLGAYQDVVQEVADKHKDKQGLVQIKWIDGGKIANKDDYETWVREQIHTALTQVLEKGYSYKDVAILVEKNKEGSQVASWLLEENIPVISSDSLQLSQSPAVRLLVAIIRKSCSTQPETDARIIGMIRNVSEEENQALAVAMQLPLCEAIERYIQIFKLNESDENSAYLQAFQDMVYGFSEHSYPDAQTFIQWWDRKGCETKLPANEKLNAVQILTIHASKGLAYPVVMMPFCVGDIYKKEGRDKLLWCKTDGTEITQLPVVPIECRRKLLETNDVFAQAYNDEHLYETIDFVNKWYVGFTRAEHALYVFSQKDKSGEEKKGLTLYKVATKITESLAKDLFVKWSNEQSEETMTVGALHDKPTKPNDTSATECEVMSLPYYSKTFQDNSLQSLLKPYSSEQQRLGNTLHQLLQFIKTPNDVEKSIAKTIRMGMLLPNQEAWARTEITKVLEHPQAKTWFDGSYSAVWNERSIMTHAHKKRKSNAIYRPDRLLVKDDTIVVVDYKFGDEHDSYPRQIKNYMYLLKDMGRWSKIEGYLYYHKTRKVESVSI
ncbi:MAG: UvrD-helicase domain-containing protein [Paludibacteraceae bacterium]|nr:UvrD-helicase domain-containing protein [Paludibacteraceae bacterium]